ncbi:MAG TPA: adenylate/guanylate cyclase domain-containing protein [Saprospiraceae bacterium]|nr:adenylate/guanylate cyclase domain-containing protein [Saprospiraceae bacterium]HMQ83464.1 adenylate/guanylate cyclase domain-containing protein [Saprospiraceae bacterium]
MRPAYTKLIVVILLTFAGGLAFGQNDELAQAETLLQKGRHRLAAAKAAQIYADAARNRDTLLMSKALFLECRSLGHNKAGLNNNFTILQNKINFSYQFAKQQEALHLAEQINQWAKNNVNLDLAGVRATGPSLQSQKPGDIVELAKEKIRNFYTRNDDLNGQLDSLFKEKNAIAINYQKEIDQLTSEQARQELLLARKQMVIDSINMARFQDSMYTAQIALELNEQNARLELARLRQTRSQILVVASVLIAGILLYLYWNSRRKNRIIEAERQKSEALLQNILPVSVAEELKSNGKVQARHYDQVTVLFTDFKDFTKISGDLPPDTLVSALDECFRAFDAIVSRYKLEKIKTIGDAYMCAGGLPKPEEGHPQQVVQAALEMQDWLQQAAHLPFRKARIGIHTGPVVAGVVGDRKFAYDIWGNTVNIAARMESAGEIDQVNLSESTYQLVKDHFPCQYRGELPAKNMGDLAMYFVKN